jgi:hypothetical protein
MSTHLQLPEKWAPRLLAQPERGMGYQTAAITLRDGSVIEDALIVGGTITEIRGYDTIPFSAGDISDIHRHTPEVGVSSMKILLSPSTSDSRHTPNQSMKPTAPFRNNFSVFATAPCPGLSLSR